MAKKKIWNDRRKIFVNMAKKYVRLNFIIKRLALLNFELVKLENLDKDNDKLNNIKTEIIDLNLILKQINLVSNKVKFYNYKLFKHELVKKFDFSLRNYKNKVVLNYVPLKSSMFLLHNKFLNSKFLSVGNYSYYKTQKNIYLDNVKSKLIKLLKVTENKKLETLKFFQLFLVLILENILKIYKNNHKLIKNLPKFFINFVKVILKNNNLILTNKLHKNLLVNIKGWLNSFSNCVLLQNFDGIKNNFNIYKYRFTSKLKLWIFFYLLRSNNLIWNKVVFNERNYINVRYNFVDLSKVKFWNWFSLFYTNINLYSLLIDKNKQCLFLKQIKFRNLIYIYFLKNIVINLSKNSKSFKVTANLSLYLKRKQQINNFLIWN